MADFLGDDAAIGDYSTWMSLSDEEKQKRFDAFKDYVEELSECEDDIKRIVRSYQNELGLRNYGYGVLAKRLREDQYFASAYTTENEYGRPSEGLSVLVIYSFIEIQRFCEEKLLVDRDFQRAFKDLLKATPEYYVLYDYLPEIFVGTEKKLRKIISVMTSALEKPFAPSSSPDKLLSQWLSPNRKLLQ